MRQYELNSVATLRYEARDADDNLVAATVTLTVTAPSGAVTQPSVTPAATGVYDAVVPTDEYGPYRFRWQASGTITDVDTGQFYVADAVVELPPLAGFDRFVKKLGYTPSEEERDRAESLLGEASELIRDVAGKTWADATTKALDPVPSRIANICVAAAFRAFGNPEGLSQRSLGDSSKSYDRTGREGGEDVYLTEAEEKSIRKAASASSMISVTLVTPYNVEPVDPWAAVTAE